MSVEMRLNLGFVGPFVLSDSGCGLSCLPVWSAVTWADSVYQHSSLNVFISIVSERNRIKMRL
jgi:hypothetical protein